MSSNTPGACGGGTCGDVPDHPQSSPTTTPSSSSFSQHKRHASRSSLGGSSRHSSARRSRQEYLDSLIPPSQEEVERITLAQERKEEEAIMRRLSVVDMGDMDDMDNTNKNNDLQYLRDTTSEERHAAALIQRNYRGHRERRMMNGLSLDHSAKWVEVVREATYRHITEPRARAALEDEIHPPGGQRGHGRSSSLARQNWRKVGLITMRAGGDEDPGEESEEDENVPPEEREEYRKRKMEERIQRQKKAKMMDLGYFLEMVDVKHRYGSNLRIYHEQWKKADTTENFFYWLDHGEGRFIDCQGCPRERLDREQVRYLTREQRLNYLVEIDNEGRLCWAKNGARIDTTERFKDSIHGIVPENDPTPAFSPPVMEPEAYSSEEETDSESSSQEHDDSDANSHKHATYHDRNIKKIKHEDEDTLSHKYSTDYDRSVKKVRLVSAATIFDKLLRGSVKENTWIFVADTNFRLYVGVKQSGAFQHSSFLHGSRISAAGSITIKNGRLSKLSPLSGHYRPPVSNFRAFISSLKDAGVDMSHVSISRSYAILVGLEAYVKSRKRGKRLVRKLVHGRDKLLSPGEVARREEEEMDRSESAARERRFLEMRKQAEKEERLEEVESRMREKLHIGSWRHEP